MQSILPEDVLREVDFAVLPKYAAHKACISADKLRVVRDCVLRTKQLAGDIAEFGVWRGGVAKMISRFDSAPIHLFDTFTGIPDQDQFPGGHGPGDFADCSVAEVQALVPNAILHVGVFPHVVLPECRFKFAHVDFDTHQSTLAACEFLMDRMVPGGLVLFDDYEWKHCKGVASAIEQVFPGRPLDRPTLHQALLRLD